MKKYLLVSLPFVIIALVTLLGFAQRDHYFYYAFDEKIPLEKLENKIVIGTSHWRVEFTKISVHG